MIAVVHLVWGPLGAEPLRRFLASLQEHPAGIDHELVMVMNNVSSLERPALVAALEGHNVRRLELTQPVQDLAAYRQAARRLEHDRLCFMNSYSRPLADGWLAKLAGALDRPRVALAGATGSAASLRSWTAFGLGMPNAYRGLLPARAHAFERFRGLQLDADRERGAAEPATAPPGRGRALAERAISTVQQLARFPGFPAPHLRTNGFLVERSAFAGLRDPRLSRKMDAYALESGHASMTRQLTASGARALLVDRDGETFEPDRWHESRTFWQGSQQGLLIADNQTGIYERGELDRRQLLAGLAWGPRAAPE